MQKSVRSMVESLVTWLQITAANYPNFWVCQLKITTDFDSRSTFDTVEAESWRCRHIFKLLCICRTVVNALGPLSIAR